MESAFKTPPHSLQLERDVLGGILVEANECMDDVAFLKPEHFYLPDHANVYRAIQELSHANQPIDMVTVTQKMREHKTLSSAFGPYEISTLTNRIASSANIEFHARILYQFYMRRESISIASRLTKSAYDDGVDVFDMHEKAATDLDKLTEFKGVMFEHGLGDLSEKFEDHNAKLLENQGLSGVTCGLTDVDRVTGGWQPTDLIVIAARPGMGKTSLALKAAIAACKADEPVAFFSLEMSRHQLYCRMASMETGIPLVKFLRKGLTPPEKDVYNEWKKISNKWRITIDDTPALSIQDLRTKCRQIKRKSGLNLIISDYIQLHTVSGFNQSEGRVLEVSKISSGQKTIAKELEVPFISLSQLSRAVEQRGGDKRPMLSDLRDSGSIEQDADMVVFIYRPEYYGITEDANGESTHGKAILDIAKYRNGSPGDVLVRWDAAHTRFFNNTMAETSPAVMSKLKPDAMF